MSSSVQELLKVKPKNTLISLLNTEVVTASNSAEKLGDTPASIMVITSEQIQRRGYRNMLEVMQDLPQIDLALSYGDELMKTYFRGYRTDLGSPFLVMIDGIIYNNLYFNQVNIWGAFPLSNVERIEVVFGPASSIYGANAFMGVINVITKKTIQQQKSLNLTGALTSSTNGYTTVDMNFFYQKNKFRFSLTGRMENGNTNQFIDPNDGFWLKDKYLADKKLWGDMVNNPDLAGKYSSPIRHRAVDARLYIDKLELGLQYFHTDNGYGNVYPADALTPNGKWMQPELSAYARYNTPIIQQKLFSRTLLRYRESYVDRSSYDLEGYNISNSGKDSSVIGNTKIAPQESIRVLQMTYWSSFNTSWSVNQDFEYRISNKFTFFTGLKYEIKSLQKAYETSSGDFFYPELLTKASVAFPPIVPKTPIPLNRINWEDRGVYAQLKWQINSSNGLHFGFRVDNNSAYGTAPTLRLGYVTKFKSFIFKAFYGEAFQEPTPRLLYGGWRGSGSDPQLKPERSRTAEITLNYTTENISNDLNIYYVKAENAIVSFAGGARNVGERDMLGLSYRVQGRLNFLNGITYWGNYSWIIAESEQKFDSKGEKIGTGTIGDLAQHKLQAGVESEPIKNLNIALTGRWTGDRETVSSNPLKNIDAYWVVDANVSYKFFKMLTLHAKVYNVFDAVYYHPGFRRANAGETEGTWDNRAWNGSRSFYNSRMPQMRRFITFSLLLDI